MTNEEFLAETQALERMLADFDRDVSVSSSSNSSSRLISSSSSPPPRSAAPSDASSSSPSPSSPASSAPASSAESSPLSMAKLMLTYEEELRHPVKNLVSGQLARCLLIQLQKVKVDSASALLEMDQVLRANELSLAATAAVPALAAVWVLGIGIRKVFFANGRAPPTDPRRAAAPLRAAFADAEDALVLAATAAAEEEGEEEEDEELVGRALFELGRSLAAVDALLGLKPCPSRASRFLPSFFLPNAARMIAGEPDESSSVSSPGSVEALPVVGGVLGSGSWRAADAARCRAGLVSLACPSASAAVRVEAAARLARSSALLK